MIQCTQCLGTGLVSPTELCLVCGGSGQTEGEVSLTEGEVQIVPPTVTDVVEPVEEDNQTM